MAKAKTAAVVSDGSKLLQDIMEWMGSFLAMPDEYRIVCALYAIHSYWFKAFASVPYLCFTSVEPQSGKSSTMETVCALSFNGKAYTDPTKATLFNIMAEHNNNVVIGWDECEAARSERDERREVINSGYRRSGSVPRVNRQWTPGSAESRIIDTPTYCPKIFALIGMVAPTVRDRSIVLWMRRGKSTRRYLHDTMQDEARGFQQRIVSVIKETFPRERPAQVECSWLNGREAELWEPLFTTARHLKLSAEQSALLRRACDLLIQLKHSDATGRYTMLRKVEDKIALANGDEPIGRRALRDMIGTFGKSEDRLWTATIIERMHKSDDWKTYRSKGLTDETLSSLVTTFGVKPKQIKIGRTNRNGYRLDDLRKVLDT